MKAHSLLAGIETDYLKKIILYLNYFKRYILVEAHTQTFLFEALVSIK